MSDNNTPAPKPFFGGRSLLVRPLDSIEAYDLLACSKMILLGAEDDLDESQKGAVRELMEKYSSGLAESLKAKGLIPEEVGYTGLPWMPSPSKQEAVKGALFGRGKLKQEAELLFSEDPDLGKFRAEVPFHNGCGSAIWRGLAVLVYGLPAKGGGAYGDIPRSTRRLEGLNPDPDYVAPPPGSPQPSAPKAPKAAKKPAANPAPKAAKKPAANPKPTAADRDKRDMAEAASSALAKLAMSEGRGVTAVAYRLATKMSAKAVRAYTEMQEQERERRREAATTLALFQIRLRDKDQPEPSPEIKAAFPSEFWRRSVSAADPAMETFLLPLEELANLPSAQALEKDLEEFYLQALPMVKMDSATFSTGSRAFIRTYQWLKAKDTTLSWVDYEDILSLAVKALLKHKADLLQDAELMKDLVGLMAGHQEFPSRYAMEKLILDEAHKLVQGQ